MLGNDNYYERFTGLWWSSLGGKVGKYVSIKAANFKVVSIYYFFCLTVDKTFFDWQELELEEAERSIDVDALKNELQQLVKDKTTMDTKMKAMEWVFYCSYAI